MTSGIAPPMFWPETAKVFKDNDVTELGNVFPSIGFLINCKDVRKDSLSKMFGILEREVSSSLLVARFLRLNKLVAWS